MKIAIATDHNGVEQKRDLIKYLNECNFEVLDCSEHNTDIDDYPLFAVAVCKAVVEHRADFGILMCGTGIGMSIAANKIKGIRCAKVANEREAELARAHNDAKVIALSYTVPLDELEKMIKIFIETPFSFDERHIRRISEISDIEADNV